MTKKPTGTAAGNSEAMRIYERMEEERLRKLQAKAESNKPKKVTLPKLKFWMRSSALRFVPSARSLATHLDEVAPRYRKLRPPPCSVLHRPR